MKSRSSAVLGLILVLILGLAACSSEESSPTSTVGLPSPTDGPPTPMSTVTAPISGTLEMRVTDAPDPAITAINITAESIEVHRSDTGQWSTIVEGPVTFDLIQVAGVEEFLGSEALPAGEYTQVRLTITEASVVDDGWRWRRESPATP